MTAAGQGTGAPGANAAIATTTTTTDDNATTLLLLLLLLLLLRRPPSRPRWGARETGDATANARGQQIKVAANRLLVGDGCQ